MGVGGGRGSKAVRVGEQRGTVAASPRLDEVGRAEEGRGRMLGHSQVIWSCGRALSGRAVAVHVGLHSKRRAVSLQYEGTRGATARGTVGRRKRAGLLHPWEGHTPPVENRSLCDTPLQRKGTCDPCYLRTAWSYLGRIGPGSVGGPGSGPPPTRAERGSYSAPHSRWGSVSHPTNRHFFCVTGAPTHKSGALGVRIVTSFPGLGRPLGEKAAHSQRRCDWGAQSGPATTWSADNTWADPS
jgi:hypothetical protein